MKFKIITKKSVKIALFAAIVAVAGWNIGQSEKGVKLSGMALENVEALTGGESGGKNNKALAQKNDGSFCCAPYEGGNCTSSPDC